MKKKTSTLVTLRQIDDMLKANKSKITQAPIIHDITSVINRYVEDGKRPLYVYCHTTGKKCGMTAIAYFQKKLAQYGNDIVRLMTEYRGRGVGSPTVATTRPTKGKAAKAAVAAAKGHNQFKSYSTWTHKSNKSGEATITRTEIVLQDGGKVLRDYNVETGEFSYIKGNAKMLTA